MLSQMLFVAFAAAEASPEAADPAASGADKPFDMADLLPYLEKYGLDALIVIVVMIIAWFIAGALGGMLSRSLKKARIEDTIALFFGKLLRWAILAMALLACLSRFGINTTSFAAVFAAAGFAVGLAFQGTLSNFSSGVMLLVFRPFKVGDYVEIGGEGGTVREIDLFTTEIDTLDNKHIVIPNSKIYGEVIQNYTYNPERRVDVEVGVHYKEDLDRTREVLKGAAETVANRLPERPVEIVLVALNSSSVDYKVRIWGNPKDYWQIREDALVACKKALDAAGLVIPFPQLDVHMDRLED